MAAAVSMGSPGATTVRFGIARMIARSSVAWCDMPSEPYTSPPPTETILTFALWKHGPLRICSRHRNVGKFAIEYVNTILPLIASPVAIPVMFCSATPTFRNLVGNSRANASATPKPRSPVSM